MPPDEEYIADALKNGQHWMRVAALGPYGPRDGVARVRSERVDITPGLGEPLAGYSIDIADRRANGWLGNLYAQVVLTDDGHGQRTAFISFDLHLGSRWVAERLAQLTAAAVGTSIDRIFFAASHTHAGPGGIYGSVFYDRGTCSLQIGGEFNAYMERLAQRIAKSLRYLAAEIDAAPPGASTLEYRESVVWGLCWQRALASHLNNYGGDVDTIDEDEVWVRAEKTAATFAPGQPLPKRGHLANDPRYFAVDPRVRCLAWDLAGPAPTVLAFVNVTPTLIGGKASILGADVFGMAARWVEGRLARKAKVAVVGSAHGDSFCLDPLLSLRQVQRLRERQGQWAAVSPLLAAAARQAERLGNGILAALGPAGVGGALPRVVSLHPTPASIRFDESTMAGCTDPSIGARMDIGLGMLKGNNLEAPSKLLDHILDAVKGSATRFPAATDAWPEKYGYGWRRKKIAVPAGPQSPKASTGVVNLLKTGSPGAMTPWVTSRVATFNTQAGTVGLRLVGVPFEPTIMAAHEIESELRTPGEPDVEVLVACLSGDYLGYLTTAAEYDVQQYEGGSVWFGRNSHAWVKAQLASMAGLAPPPAWFGMTRPEAWFSSAVEKHMLPNDALGHATDGVLRAARLRVLPTTTLAMRNWLRLEGTWWASDHSVGSGTPSALDPQNPTASRPWVQLRVGSTAAGLAPAVLESGVLADDQCGWMLMRREGRKNPGGNSANRVMWRWSFCAPFPPAWRGQLLSFEVLSTHPGVAMVNGPITPVTLPGSLPG